MRESRMWFLENVLAAVPGDVTFALIKPDASIEQRVAIESTILDAGFTIADKHVRKLTDMDIMALYWVHKGKPFYPRNAEFMGSGPSTLLALKGPKVQPVWRTEIMPGIRAMWPTSPEAKCRNLVHGSDSEENAFRELQYFFS